MIFHSKFFSDNFALLFFETRLLLQISVSLINILKVENKELYFKNQSSFFTWTYGKGKFKCKDKGKGKG